MKLEDCTPGTRVVIGPAYESLGLYGAAGVIVVAEPPAQLEHRQLLRRLDGIPADDLYPHGMVQVDLYDGQAPEYPHRSPWLDAAGLDAMPAWEAELMDAQNGGAE